MDLVLGLAETSHRNPEWTAWTTPKNLGVEDQQMASSPITSYPTYCKTILDDLDVPGPAVTTVAPDEKNVGEMDSDKTDKIMLFKKNNYKFYMCVEIMSNILQSAFMVFNRGSGLNLFYSTFVSLKWCKFIRPIREMYVPQVYTRQCCPRI